MIKNISKDTENFLEAVLFGFNWDYSELSASDWNIYDFHDSFVNGVDQFIRDFDTYLERLNDESETEELGVAIDFANNCERSFGGNIYWSLSGHGVGFWGESEPWGSLINDHLITFAGNEHKFEQLDLFEVNGTLLVELVDFSHKFNV